MSFFANRWRYLNLELVIVLDPLTNVVKRHFKSEDTLHTGKVVHREQTTGRMTNRDWWHKQFETESLSSRRRQPLDQRHRIDIDPQNFYCRIRQM